MKKHQYVSLCFPLLISMPSVNDFPTAAATTVCVNLVCSLYVTIAKVLPVIISKGFLITDGGALWYVISVSGQWEGRIRTVEGRILNCFIMPNKLVK